MPSLAELSEQRIATGVQQVMNEFAPGKSLPERLQAGRDAALSVVRKYRPDFEYDPAAAEMAMRDIDAWSERNNQALSAAMAAPVAELPAQLQLQMGSERAQAFILSSFTEAAAGLGPWTSGAVAKEASSGELINDRWARADAADRLETFALIVKMEREGTLETIFVPPDAAGALGLVVPVWLIVVALVAVAAAVVVLVLGWRRISLNNRLMADICKRAQDEGDIHTLQHCIEATKGLQINPFEKAITDVGKKFLYALATAGVVYAGLRWGLPWLAKRRGTGSMLRGGS